MKTYTEWLVEYDFQIDKSGNNRPNFLRGFSNEEDAKAFAATKSDANVVAIEQCEYTFEEQERENLDSFAELCGREEE